MRGLVNQKGLEWIWGKIKMGEIKFRQKMVDFKGGKWFHYWGFTSDGYGISFVGPLGNPEEAQENSEQYTGKKDKNGTEIYEGDLILNRDYVEDANAWNEWEREVVYDSDTAQYTGIEGEEFEAIRNVHEGKK